ncbi:hypothetical protein K0M31_001036 [Melipona bicolor]|uniref:Uncharacterized protein n=1 Tax=Melipona bicolor TaxID=60889 RepID=A0AA40GEQ6_9HYME|nr:hypothetical protein K0M31_001036 [Melipona bicolor]
MKLERGVTKREVKDIGQKMESSTTTVESTRAFRGERPVNKKPGMSLRSLFDILVEDDEDKETRHAKGRENKTKTGGLFVRGGQAQREAAVLSLRHYLLHLPPLVKKHPVGLEIDFFCFAHKELGLWALSGYRTVLSVSLCRMRRKI